MIFAPPHYLSKVKGYSKLLLCEAPKPHKQTYMHEKYTKCSFFPLFDSIITDGWTDGQTDKASHRVACPQLKRLTEINNREMCLESLPRTLVLSCL